MNSRMEILTEVTFRHGYFRDGLFRGLSVRPADSSIRKMMGHGLLLKVKPGGFRLLYDTNHVGSQRSWSDVLSPGLAIRILLYLEDLDLYNYTSPLPMDPDSQVLLFCNRPGRPFLHKEEQVSGSDLFEVTAPCQRPGRKIILEPAAQRPFERPFALLDLRLYPGRLEKNYQIFFQARSTWWNYILVGDHLKELPDPAILYSGRKKQAFAGPFTVPLPDGRTGLSFVSPAPVEARETPESTCTLVESFDQATERYKVVIPTLPVPDAKIISRVHARYIPVDHSTVFLY